MFFYIQICLVCYTLREISGINMEIRKSTKEDIDKILKIFDIARNYMINNGNPTQWEKGYPGRDIVEQDIQNGNSYLIIDNEEVVGTFSFIIGEDETYKNIINGNWRKENTLYGTIHRLASCGKKNGIARTCFDYCSSKINYLRIDTHENNLVMQSAILNYGFKKCGNIFARDRTIRNAYDWYC